MFLIKALDLSPFPFLIRPERVLWKNGSIFLDTSEYQFEFECTYVEFSLIISRIDLGVCDITHLYSVD